MKENSRSSNLAQKSGKEAVLEVVNMYMEERPPTNSQTWLTSIRRFFALMGLSLFLKLPLEGACKTWTQIVKLAFCPLIMLPVFSATAGEPAWWTQQKRDCGLSPSIDYNTWVGMGSPCNRGKNNNNSQSSGPSAAQIAAERAEEEQAQRDADAEAAAKKAALDAEVAREFQQSKQAGLSELRDINQGRDFDSGLKGAGTTDSSLKGIREPNDLDTEVRQEQDEFEKMNAAWMKNQKQLIQQRLQEPNRWGSAIYASLKTKEPPLPYKKFTELQPGDVLLISPDGILGDLIRGVDRLSSLESKSPASHTVLYLKEVNGKKLFLDNTAGIEDATSGRGPHIITEAEFLKSYSRRDTDVAAPAALGVAQPLNKSETARLWAAASQLGIKELASESSKSGNLIDKTNFGLYGDGNMVCSKASRWALVRSGRKIPETDSPLKKLMGVDFGPANFFSDEQDFIVSPMGVPK